MMPTGGPVTQGVEPGERTLRNLAFRERECRNRLFKAVLSDPNGPKLRAQGPLSTYG